MNKLKEIIELKKRIERLEQLAINLEGNVIGKEK